MSDLVTVTAYTRRADAQAAQGVLDGAGIESEVDDTVEQRAKVRVETVDAIRAGDVLTARVDGLSEIEEADEPDEAPSCPACGSLEVTPSQRGRMFGLVVALATAVGLASGFADAAFLSVGVAGVFLLITGRHRCAMCGETWD
jgi:hypothetical protein